MLVYNLTSSYDNMLDLLILIYIILQFLTDSNDVRIIRTVNLFNFI